MAFHVSKSAADLRAATLSLYELFTRDSLARWRRRLKQILLIAAVGLFFTGLYLALRTQPDILDRISLGPFLIIMLVALPSGMAINAVDYQLLGRLSGVKVNFWRALEVVIFTRAANMLPVPGSFAVRMAALSAEGVSLRKSGGLMILFTCLWGGMGFCFSALWLFKLEQFAFAALFAAIGLSILAACAATARKTGFDGFLVGYVAFLRLALIALEGLILMMAMHSVGVTAEYQQTAVLVVASFLSSIIPAGLGVRETFIAVLSPLAAIDPSLGFLAAVAVRGAAMLLLAVCALAALILQRLRR